MSDPRHGILLFFCHHHFGNLALLRLIPRATYVFFELQTGVETPSETDFVTI